MPLLPPPVEVSDDAHARGKMRLSSAITIYKNGDIKYSRHALNARARRKGIKKKKKTITTTKKD